VHSRMRATIIVDPADAPATATSVSTSGGRSAPDKPAYFDFSHAAY